jgi:glycosyltransferase involved in cell wall biosynthesis
MEIIVVDDCSQMDNPEEVVTRLGGNRVKFVRQKENVGKVRNYETGLLASRGHLVHQLHGDDRILPGFYEAMSRAFDTFRSAGAFFCEARYITHEGRVVGQTGLERSDTGILDGWLERIFVSQRIQSPSMVVRRVVYEELGGFDRRFDMMEDWEMWIRIASRFPVGFLAAALADYRLSPTGASAMGLRSGQVNSHLRLLREVVDHYLPSHLTKRLQATRSRETAQYISQLIPELVNARQYRAVLGTYRDVMRNTLHPRAIYRMFYFTYHYRRFLKE